MFDSWGAETDLTRLIVCSRLTGIETQEWKIYLERAMFNATQTTSSTTSFLLNMFHFPTAEPNVALSIKIAIVWSDCWPLVDLFGKFILKNNIISRKKTVEKYFSFWNSKKNSFLLKVSEILISNSPEMSERRLSVFDFCFTVLQDVL